MKKTIVLLAFALVCGFAHVSHAQALTIDITTGVFRWGFTQNSHPATSFHLYCGAASGVYTLTYNTPNVTTLSAPVSSILTADGTYFCVVKSFASSTGLESKASNEVTFSGAVPPATPSSLSVQ